MKRIIFAICTILCANVLFAQTRFWVDSLQYEVTSTNPAKVKVYNANESITIANIPAIVTYQGITYDVTTIGDWAFAGCSSLTSVTIPNSVTSIGGYAFYGCSSLTSVTIPNSVTSIGGYAFSYCSSLTSVTIPNSVTSIGDGAFADCSSLTSVTCLISNSPSLGGYVFDGTPNNKTLTLPCGCESEYTDWQNATTWASIDCIETIGSRFTIGDLTYEITSETEVKVQACTQSATSVVIPETVTYQGTTYSVTSIGESAFSGCSSLTSVTIPNSVISIGYAAFYYCSSLTSVTIPNSVTSIGDFAFSYCSSLTSVTIPNSVTSIGNYAFEGCISLTSVTIPNSVTSIGVRVFYNCSSLTSIDIPNSVTSIGASAFQFCSSLTSVTIPNSVTSIGNYAFIHCSSLTSVTIPNSVTSIGEGAFKYCSSLTSVTCLRSNSPSLDSDVFVGTPNNKTLTIPCGCESEYTDWQNATTWASIDCIETIGSRFTIGDLTYEITSETEVKVQACTQSATSVVIPETVTYQGTTYSVTSIGYAAFAYCSSLTSVTIPNSVTSIDYWAFYDCSSLTSVTIPNSVTSIGNYAFQNCSSLTSVTIPNSVTSIGDQAFYYCSSLTSVEIPNSVSSIGDWSFGNCSSLTSIDIPNSVTSIGSTAFYYCTGLESINLSDNITSIGRNCFDSCINLTTVNIPTSLSVIDTSLFRYCTSLTSVTIPNSVTSIGYAAFIGCSSLTSITIPNSVTSIGNRAFQSCSSLTSITIPNSVTSIENYAFLSCSSLTSIAIPNSVTSIGELAFYECSSLTSVTIPNSVTYIGYQAFIGCSSLTSVTLGNSVTSIQDMAFAYCSSLTSVTCLANTPPYLGDDVFYNTPSNKILNVNCGLKDDYISSWTDFYSYNIHEIPFVVNATANNETFGSVAVENNCSTATLTATANNCYQFVSWNDGNTDNPRIVNLTSDTSFVANFGALVVNTDITATICQGQTYTENGFNVSEAGVYTQNLTSVNGCDSIVTLSLNVNPTFNTELSATICQGSVYTENNFNVSEAGVYTQTLTSANGCDSIVTLTLNVNPIYNTELSANICQGQVYDENGFNVSEAGIYTQNLTSVNGCDSIVTLTVSVNPVFDTTINATINTGETYAEFGFNESESGTYVQNLQTVNGCDSTITLNLTVNSSLYDVAELTEITFYPNPTSGKVTFSKEIEKIEVIDNIGKVVMRFFDTNEINIETLSSGAYYLRMTIEDKTIMRKIIKE